MDRTEREYIEIMASIRHYSNLRFAVMSIFYAATAGLTVVVFEAPKVESGIPAYLILYLKLGGILVTLVLFLYDIICDTYQTSFRKYLKTVWPESHWFRRPAIGRFTAVPAWTLYVGALVFWAKML